MPKRAFTDTWLKTIAKTPPAERTDYGETGRRGFMVRHFPGGSLTFCVRYQRDGGPTQRITLGNYPTMSLAAAHNEHTEIRRQLAHGLDPAAERGRAARLAEAAPAQLKTVRNVIAEWGWHYARRRRKRPREGVRMLKAALLPYLEGKPVREITKRDLVECIDRILKRDAPVQANRTAGVIRQLFQLAAERDLLEMSPASGLNRKPGGDEYSRERWLNRDEVAVLWRTIGTNQMDESDRRKQVPGEVPISRPIRLALKLILVTGQRPGEVGGARLAEFDLTARVWTIPSKRIKTVKKGAPPRDHFVPLTDIAVELIRELTELGRGSPFLLPGKHRIHKPGRALSDKALSRALHNCVVEVKDKPSTLFGMPVFTPHDLRRTAASHMAGLGIERLHIDKVQNHSDDTTGGVYDRFHYWDQKLRALTVWDTDLRDIIAGKPAKVTKLFEGRAA